MPAVASAVSAPGFADAPREAQRVFRAVMDAMARPALPGPLAVALTPPAPLTPELAAIALALCDGDSPLWLDAALGGEPAVAAWLRFHTGAPLTGDPAEAAFALAADPAALPPLENFAPGSEEFPDRSTTIVLAVRGFSGAETFCVEGPGVKGRASVAPEPLPGGFREQWRANRKLFPRGVDLVFAGGGQVAALPRSARLVEG